MYGISRKQRKKRDGRSKKQRTPMFHPVRMECRRFCLASNTSFRPSLRRAEERIEQYPVARITPCGKKTRRKREHEDQHQGTAAKPSRVSTTSTWEVTTNRKGITSPPPTMLVFVYKNRDGRLTCSASVLTRSRLAYRLRRYACPSHVANVPGWQRKKRRSIFPST